MSGVVQADWYCVFAKTGPADSRKHDDISCFIVERSWPGVTVGRTDDKMGVVEKFAPAFGRTLAALARDAAA